MRGVREHVDSGAVHGGGATHGRRWKRVAVVLLVVFLLLVGVDRLAEILVARELASSIQTSQNLSVRPRVSIAGFPFLTQVLQGRYGNVSIDAMNPIERDGVPVTGASVQLSGVRVGLADALGGTIANVPVAAASGTAVISYSTLNVVLQRYLGSAGAAVRIVGGRPGQALLMGPFGLSVTLAARITDGALTFVPRAAGLRSLPTPIRALATIVLARPLPLPSLPFGVHIQTGVFQPDGLHLSAFSKHTLIPIH